MEQRVHTCPQISQQHMFLPTQEMTTLDRPEDILLTMIMYIPVQARVYLEVMIMEQAGFQKVMASPLFYATE